MDPSKVASAIREIGDPTPLLQAVDVRIEKFDAEHRAERLIHPEDGL